MASLQYVFVELREQHPDTFLMVDVACKATLLLLMLVMSMRLLRRASSGLRYCVLSLGFFGLFLLPLLASVLPNWNLAVLPAGSLSDIEPDTNSADNSSTALAAETSLKADRTESRVLAASPTEIAATSQATAPAEVTSQTAAVELRNRVDPDCGCIADNPLAVDFAQPASSAAIRLPAIEAGNESKQHDYREAWLSLITVWIAVGVGLLCRIVMGVVGWHRLIQGSAEVDDPRWLELCDSVSREVGLSRRTRLLVRDDEVVPMAGGVLWPTVVLPHSSRTWSDERRRVVLLHELTHVARWDPLAVVVSRIVCAVYWFHPLVWLGAKWMRMEREHSCDDQVLAAGFKPSQYGRHLLEIATQCRANHQAAAVGMPRRSQIEDRLTAILAIDRQRTQFSWSSAMAITAAFFALVLPIATVQLDASPATADDGHDQSDVEFASDSDNTAFPATEDFDSTLGEVSADRQWNGSSGRNNVVKSAVSFPVSLEADDVAWTAKLGSLTYGSPVASGGRVFVGTNNSAGHVERLPADIDLGCLVCVRESDGEFLWQYSARKLAESRLYDQPHVGICSTPLVNASRLWFVSNRCELVCLDTDGFADGENDGPFQEEESTDHTEADVVWTLDMMTSLGVRPLHMSNCSVTGAGDMLFVVTSNARHGSKIEAPDAPSFIAVERDSGRVLWTDSSPGANILHGQWGSPAYGVIAGIPQVIFPGGDGWVYSFDARAMRRGQTSLIWKFDCNSKTSEWRRNGRGDRNTLLATPVIHQDRVLIATGKDPQGDEGQATLWCIDATRTGDVSEQLVVAADEPSHVIPHRWQQACDEARGEVAVPNANSAVVWKYGGFDTNTDGRLGFGETLHNVTSSVAVANDKVVIPDIAGLVHCVDFNSGNVMCTHDMMAAVYATPLVVNNQVLICDEDGDVVVLALQNQPSVVAEWSMGTAIYTTPMIVGERLLIAGCREITAIRIDPR